jgi:hypothetical protein
MPWAEIWQPVCNGCYEVSANAEVRNAKTKRLRKIQTGTGRGIVKLQDAIGQPAKWHRVAVLVLEAFVKPRPPGMIACHGPNGILDDSLLNVYWGLYHTNNGVDRMRDDTSLAKLSPAQVLEIKERLPSETDYQIAKDYPVGAAAIRHIRRGLTWEYLA